MEALAQKKVTEAKEHISDAEKSLKTSLFKRKPDLDSAAGSYAKAALCYKIIKDYKNAIDYSIKSGDTYNEHGSLYNAAKQYEQAGIIANDIKSYNQTYEMFEKATELMITNGTRDSAGILLERGANMLKLTAPDKALRLFKRAIHVADIEEKYHESLSYYENAINIAIRTKEYNEAIELINNSFGVIDRVGSNEQITKYILTACLIHLSRDDWVSAQNYLEGMKNKYEVASDSRGFGRVDDLIKAYDEKDDEMFKTLIKNYLSYAVDNEVLKIANQIVKSDEWIRSVQANSGSVAVKTSSNSYEQNSQNYNDEPSSHNMSSSNKGEDDDDIDLC